MSFVNELTAERERLQQRIEAIDTLLAAYDGQAPKRTTRVVAAGRGRAARRGGGGRRMEGGTLKDYIRRVLSKQMSVADVTAAVERAGYESSNKTLDKSVGIALTDLAKKKEARKVSRGVYAPK